MVKLKSSFLVNISYFVFRIRVISSLNIFLFQTQCFVPKNINKIYYPIITVLLDFLNLIINRNSLILFMNFI